MKPRVLDFPVGQLAGVVRMFSEPTLNVGPGVRIQLAVQKGVQIQFGNTVGVIHFTLRRIWEFSSLVRTRSLSRPRDSRDMIVPTGTPNISDASR